MKKNICLMAGIIFAFLSAAPVLLLRIKSDLLTCRK